MIKFPKLWKAYFIITLSLGAIGLGTMAIFSLSGWELVVEIISNILMIIGFIGLFGFVYQTAILKKQIWVWFFIINYSYSFIHFWYYYFTIPGYSQEWEGEWVLGIVLFAFFIPMLLGHFLYAFKSQHLWKSAL